MFSIIDEYWHLLHEKKPRLAKVIGAVIGVTHCLFMFGFLGWGCLMMFKGCADLAAINQGITPPGY